MSEMKFIFTFFQSMDSGRIGRPGACAARHAERARGREGGLVPTQHQSKGVNHVQEPALILADVIYDSVQVRLIL